MTHDPRKLKNISTALWVAGCFCFLFALLLATKAPAQERVRSDRYAEDAIEVPLNSETICVGEGVYRRCWNREIEPEPRSGADCAEGEIMITKRQWGVVNRQCVPE